MSTLKAPVLFTSVFYATLADDTWQAEYTRRFAALDEAGAPGTTTRKDAWEALRRDGVASKCAAILAKAGDKSKLTQALVDASYSIVDTKGKASADAAKVLNAATTAWSRALAKAGLKTESAQGGAREGAGRKSTATGEAPKAGEAPAATGEAPKAGEAPAQVNAAPRAPSSEELVAALLGHVAAIEALIKKNAAGFKGARGVAAKDASATYCATMRKLPKED